LELTDSHVTKRTYWHLEELGRRPSDYEIATSKLLYYLERGLEVEVPIGDWNRRYQQGSPIRSPDWERFRDPRETTYSSYVEAQRNKEALVDGLFEMAERNDYDRRLSPEWLTFLSGVLGPLRYPVHGLQMVAAYVGQIAPAGRIAIVSLFQAADEVRRIQRFAYRMRQLQRVLPEFGVESRALWQDGACWQPLREVVERLLVTYDWGEAFVALNVVLKPLFDELFMTRLALLARASGDDLLERVLCSLNEDCSWHRDWTRSLVALALEDSAENREVMQRWVSHWAPQATRAINAVEPLFNAAAKRCTDGRAGSLAETPVAAACDYWTTIGLTPTL
jgi:toluene monooxygenase system protein E